MAKEADDKIFVCTAGCNNEKIKFRLWFPCRKNLRDKKRWLGDFCSPLVLFPHAMLNLIITRNPKFCLLCERIRSSLIALDCKKFSNLKLDEKLSPPGENAENLTKEKPRPSSASANLSEIRLRLVERLTEQNKQLASEWKPIYKFDAMPITALISRIKLYQTILMVAATPILAIMYLTGHLDNPMSLYTAAVASAAALSVLCLFSVYTRRLVGVISLNNKDEKTVRIGHLTFWGKRKNVVCDFEDLLPLSDLDYRQTDLYAVMRRYSDPKFKLFLPMKSYTIVDKEMFAKVFETSFLTNGYPDSMRYIIGTFANDVYIMKDPFTSTEIVNNQDSSSSKSPISYLLLGFVCSICKNMVCNDELVKKAGDS
uniref:Transmembrane protein 186 n=1 Tax=Romanomermis culicivorax TaxID=13658 RepID=A0A915I5E2_ROMCU